MEKSRKKLVIFEGPDNIGKSTLVQLVADRMGAKVVNQPGEDNSLGWLRPTLKNGDIVVTGFERQLLHTCSHIVDLVERFNHDFIIMDRSIISALVYCEFQGLNDEQKGLLKKLNFDAYQEYLNTTNTDVLVIFLNNKEPFAVEEDINYANINWSELRQRYSDTMANLTEDEFFYKFKNVRQLENTPGDLDGTVSTVIDLINNFYNEQEK